MRSPQGYVTIASPSGSEKEADTFTCFHCQRIVMVRPLEPPENMGGVCKVCYKLICPRCVGAGVCSPFERQLEEIEARDRFRRQLEGGL